MSLRDDCVFFLDFRDQSHGTERFLDRMGNCDALQKVHSAAGQCIREVSDFGCSCVGMPITGSDHFNYFMPHSDVLVWDSDHEFTLEWKSKGKSGTKDRYVIQSDSNTTDAGIRLYYDGRVTINAGGVNYTFTALAGWHHYIVTCRNVAGTFKLFYFRDCVKPAYATGRTLEGNTGFYGGLRAFPKASDNEEYAEMLLFKAYDRGVSDDEVRILYDDPLWQDEHCMSAAWLAALCEEEEGNGDVSNSFWILTDGLGSWQVLADGFGGTEEEAELTATIDSIEPNPAHSNQVISFAGHGAGGTIVAYEWSSDIDGLLSILAEFLEDAGNLTLGQHVISFRVQDDQDNWSEADTAFLTVQPAEQPHRPRPAHRMIPGYYDDILSL